MEQSWLVDLSLLRLLYKNPPGGSTSPSLKGEAARCTVPIR